MADGVSTDHRGWVPGDGFREWAHRQLVEAEIEKVESKVRYTIDDVIRFGRPYFANVLEARLAVALAGVISRFICEPVPADDFDALIADRIERNHRAPHNRVGALLVPKQSLGEAATDMLIVALFDDVKERRDVVEKIAVFCIAQGREVPRPGPADTARRKLDMEALETQGVKVFRFLENEILSDALDCARTVNRHLTRIENNYARTYNYRAAVGCVRCVELSPSFVVPSGGIPLPGKAAFPRDSFDSAGHATLSEPAAHGRFGPYALARSNPTLRQQRGRRDKKSIRRSRKPTIG